MILTKTPAPACGTLLLILATISGCRDAATLDSPSHFSTWQHYLGDPGRSHFSLLDQIDTTNVNDLKVAWVYQSGGLDIDRSTQMQTNPLIVGDRLYGVNASMRLFALNAATGERIWQFEPEGVERSGLGVNRGLTYLQSQGETPSQLFFATGPRLFAISPDDGSVISTFGDSGSIDLREGLGRDPETLSVVANTPGVIYNNILIMGTRVGEGPGSAPGHIRAYDVHTGDLVWTFHTIPQPQQFGYDTWPPEAYKTVGGANNWAGMALDGERGIVFLPTGSAAFDFYGGDRHGANLFANTLIALDAETGERLWHFQAVRHDLWDRDFPAPPNLVNLYMDGKRIPAVAQITKSGHVFVFHRQTGEPLFPIEEKQYPPSLLDGEQAFLTQPLPTKPKPFSRQLLTESDLYAPDRPAFLDDFVDESQNIDPPTVLEKLRSVTSKGQFIPPDTKGVIVYPGFDGGAEWGGAAVDPRSGVMYVNSNEMAWILRMVKVVTDEGEKQSQGAILTQIHCARCHGGQLQGLGDIPGLRDVGQRLSEAELEGQIKDGQGAMPAMPNLSDGQVASIVAYLNGVEMPDADDHRAVTSNDVPYGVAGFGRFKDDRGFPVVKPPWGVLNALDLNTGEYLWQVPLGHEKEFNDPEYPVSGTENYGGPVITAGGVLFIAATRDEKIRAFNLRNGKMLWEEDLPAGGYATPATYEVDGKQYLVVACGGGKMGTKSGDAYVAFALEN